MQTATDIRSDLVAPANAAIAWLNAEDGATFELTGLADVPGEPIGVEPFELGLVMCDGEICARQQVRIQTGDEGYSFDRVPAPGAIVPPLLDPPPGLRRTWLSEQLDKFDFILLLFYRGRW